MLHFTKFPLFALLALLGLSSSGCSSTFPLNSDPATSAKIERETIEHRALITLYNGSQCIGKDVEIRTDSTQWIVDTVFVMRSTVTGEALSGPIFVTRSAATDSVRSIRVYSPRVFLGVIAGSMVGELIGGLIGRAFSPSSSSIASPPPAPVNNSHQDNGINIGFDGPIGPPWQTMLGIGIGLVAGGIAGGETGGTVSTLYTRDSIPSESPQ